MGFVLKRPKKRLVKANAEKRDAFVADYAVLRTEAEASGAKIFFVDEAHFRADVDLRAKWVLRGEPALADSTSPRLGEKASYYSGVCLETGEVEYMVVTENCTAESSVAFLRHLRERYVEPLIVIVGVWKLRSVPGGSTTVTLLLFAPLVIAPWTPRIENDVMTLVPLPFTVPTLTV